MEMNAVIQIYEVDDRGKIYADCLQEIPAINPDYFSNKKWTGIAMHGPAEMYVTETELLVSNRGMTSRLGSSESGIRIFNIEDGGSKLTPKQVLDTTTCGGPVRHFWMNEESTKLYAGINMGTPEVVHTYTRNDPSCTFTKLEGEANVDMDVLCIARM
jgi:6-phosphogluconolactonase (cycloisomerase 2 family)